MNQSAKERKTNAQESSSPAAPTKRDAPEQDAAGQTHDSQTQDNHAPPTQSRASRHRLIIILITLLIATWLGLGYLRYSDQFISTQDAFIGGNQTQIGPEVSGLIQSTPWQNNSNVHQGDILFTLDPTPYRLEVEAAKAGLAAAEREQKTVEAAITTAQARLKQQEAAAQQAQEHLHRLRSIKDKQFVSAQALTDAESAVAVAKAAVEQARAQLAQAKINAGKPGAQNDRIKAAQSRLAQAEYNLGKTVVRAPMSGRLANYNIEPGQPVNANQTVCSIVANNHLWVDANIKETELGKIRVGQTAKIESDIYPGHIFKGHVLSIAAGSGNAFSLLPPQNATGNWVKVTQRVPVRIVFDQTDTKLHLPIGTSTTTTIELQKNPHSYLSSLLSVIGLGGLVDHSAQPAH